MGEIAIQQYLNPLTLEAHLFLDSLQTYGKACNQIDSHLLKTLENVVISVEKFLGQKLSTVVATENTKLVPERELNSIRRVYHCQKCKLDLGCTADKAAVHLVDGHNKTRNELRKEKLKADQENRAKMMLKLPKKTISLISNDFDKFFTDNIMVAEKLKQIPEYDVIEKELMNLLTPLFPDKTIKLYKFGSRITGIGTRNSDLDIFVDIGKTFNTFENRASAQTKQSLKRVRDTLKKHHKVWPHLRAIENARVPILRVLNGKTDIECDIGFSNSLGYCNTKLLQYLFELQPIARRMCLFLKRWVERSKLNDHITTYSLSLMVIYFLQINKYLPSIEALQFSMDAAVCVGPWIANFVQKKPNELNIEIVDVSAKNCTNFLKLFFELYADFSFSQYVVCPYFGRLTPIVQIEAEMPERYSTYVKSAEATKEYALQLDKCIVVQDPIQLNHNVAKAISPLILKQITDYFRQSADAFAELKPMK